jgi:hypothetical protein
MATVKKAQAGKALAAVKKYDAMKKSALTEAEQAAIEAHGLYNLAEFLPKRPGEAELRVIKEMFDASVDGQPYDLERWGSYYRPWGLEAPAGATAEKQTATTETRAPATAPVAETSAPWEDEPMTTTAPVSVPAAGTSSDKAQDILAMIRARQNKS